MNYKKGICLECNQEKYIVKAFYKLCNDCNDKRLEAQKEQKPKQGLKKSSIKYKTRKPTGEGVLFEAIWNTRKHVCVSCDNSLGNDAKVSFFSHIIQKGKRNDLRLLDRNIVLECEPCHHTWDFGTLEQKSKMKSFDKKMEFIKEMDNELYQTVIGKLETL